MNIQPRQLVQALFFITLICVLVFFFVISTQSTADLNYLDNPWYLNRARLIWEGILPDLFVYTLAYPTFIGLIDQFLGDAILSGMLANGLALWLLLVGTYVLGHWLYGRKRVAWLAVLMVALNGSMFTTLRYFWPYVPFTTVVIWCVIAYQLVIRRPGFGTAALLGGMLALALYIRFEGSLYSVLIAAAAWEVNRQRHDRRLAVQILLAAGAIFTVLAVPFAINFAQVRQNLNSDLSANVTGIFTLLDRTPIEWPVIWRRVTDTVTGFLYHWNSLAWIVGLAGVIWASARCRAAQRFCAALIGFNLLYTFILSIWPYPIQLMFYIPLFALILAAALDQMTRRGRSWKLAALPLYALIVLPGMTTLAPLATREPPMAYRTSDAADKGAALDGWLREQGLEQTRIYTFCNEITSFSRAHFQILYRLQFATGWDAPERLVPLMREEEALLMTCGGEIFFPDWHLLFQEGTPPGLREAGRFDIYEFYRPDDK